LEENREKPNNSNEPIDIGELLPRQEHGIYAYYGRIGQGKTYAMTADVIEALKQGRVVYVNYPIDWSGFYQKKRMLWLFLGILGLKREYIHFKPDNLHRIEIDEDFHDTLATLTDCIVALDEGYVVMDSYEMAKMSMKKRKNVLHTRHFDRSIWYTTQRTNAVHVTLRAQTNVFYKVTKLLSWPFVVFRRQEFDLATDDSVNENEPISTKLYLGKPYIFNAYNTKYLRGGIPRSQEVNFEAFDFSYKDRWVAFIHSWLPRINARKYVKLFFTWLGVKPRITTIKQESKPAKGLWPLRKLSRSSREIGTISTQVVSSKVGSTHLPVADLSEQYIWRIAKLAKEKSVYRS